MKTIDQLRKINRIISLCINISQNTQHDAFFYYSGHVDSVTVNFWRGGFDYDNKNNPTTIRHYLSNPEFNDQDFYNTKSLEEIEEFLKGYEV